MVLMPLKAVRSIPNAGMLSGRPLLVPECGEEAWSVNREPMDKNCIEGAAVQGERATHREALVTKAKQRKCGGCAMKECALTQWDGRPHS